MFSCLRASGHPRSCFPVITPCSSHSIVLVLRRRPSPRSLSERWPCVRFGLKKLQPERPRRCDENDRYPVKTAPDLVPLQGALQLNNKRRVSTRVSNLGPTTLATTRPHEGARCCGILLPLQGRRHRIDFPGKPWAMLPWPFRPRTRHQAFTIE
jgi:hypothetical protein